MIWKDLERSGRSLTEILFQEFFWKDWVKLRKSSIGRAGDPAGIRNERVVNMNQRYRYTNVLCKKDMWPLSYTLGSIIRYKDMEVL
jgi:hypothetical protein